MVRIDKEKYMMARAKACMGPKDLEKAGVPRGTLSTALQREVRPETAGKIAKALGVEVSEIIVEEDQ